MNIFELIKQETLNHRDKTAIIDGDCKLSYAELISFAEKIAGTLKSKGVEPFQRIGVLCDNSRDYVSLCLAILSLSAVAVPISPDYTKTEIDSILDDISVDYLFFKKGLFEHSQAWELHSAGFCKNEFFILKRQVRETPHAEYYKINPAFIRFSSGTTGSSKGVVLSHEAIAERTDAADKGLHITSEDTVLWVLSMSFHFVVSILLYLRRAATIVLCHDSFLESLALEVTKHSSIVIYASPLHYNLLANSELLQPESLSRVRLAVSTTAKLPDGIAHEFAERFGFALTEAYGIIEVGLPFINLSSVVARFIGQDTVGHALPDYEVKIANQDAEGAGEICLRGKGMLDAYFSPWQNRLDILRDGWFHTGDLGRLDEAGFLTIVGRKKNVINFTGMKVFPQEVEMVINQHPLVKESLVYGEDHPRYGQLPMAKIVLRKEADPDTALGSLRQFCYQRLAPYKVPKGFEPADQIPKTASGKIKR